MPPPSRHSTPALSIIGESRCRRPACLTNAAAHFERAMELNPDNLVAEVNLECNKNLRAGLKTAVQVSKSIEDEFGKYRNWDQVIGENGPFDEPNFCFEQGRVFVSNTQYRQAAAQFDRVKTLAPENLAARIWLGQLYVVSRMPDKALRTVNQIRAQPDLRPGPAPTGMNCSLSKPPRTWPRTTSGARRPPCRRQCGGIPATQNCWPPRRRSI